MQIEKMEFENPEENFEEQCGVVYLTANGFLSIHCSLCEKRYKGFDDYAKHIEEEHISTVPRPDYNTESLDCSEHDDILGEFNEESNSILIERYIEVAESIDEEDITSIEFKQLSPNDITNEEFSTNEEIEDVIVEGKINEELVCYEETIIDDENELGIQVETLTKPTLKNSKSNRRTDKSSKLTPAMKRRLKREADGPIYKCPECGFSCNDKSNLLGHIKRHSNNKPHTCTECSKGFHTRTELSAHQRSHTGERPFLCTNCGKGFTTSSKLTLHAKRHTNQRDKQCPICDKKFYSSTRLRDHMLIHSDDRPFECSLCGTGFKSYTAMKNHRKLHENKKRYKCPLCSARFNQNPGLYMHMKKKHSLVTNNQMKEEIF